LNAAPLAAFAIGIIGVYWNIQKAFGDFLKEQGVPSPLSWSWGVFVLGTCALVLAAQTLKPSASR
jgi:hypothetical protein